MKKSLLTLALAGVFCFSYNLASHAADVSITKPGIKVNTSQEESVLSKKLQQVDNAKSDVKSHENALKKDVKDTKSDLKSKENSLKKGVKDTKSEAKSKKKNAKKNAKNTKEQTKKSIKDLNPLN